MSRLGGTIFHSVTWAAYQQEVLGADPLFLLARDEHEREIAAAVGFVEQSRHPLARLVLRDLSLSSHPAVRPGAPEVAADVVRECERVARALGCRQIRVDSFMSGGSTFSPAACGYTESQRLEFCLDLTRDRDSLWKGIRKDQRERITRLHREGVNLEVGASLEDLRGLASARESTRDRRALKGQGYDLDGNPVFYDRLHRHLVQQGAGRLFLARCRGEVVAAIFFSTFNARAYSVFSGSTQTGYRLGAQAGLFWTAVETFRAEGYELLNRGGLPADAQLETDPLHGIYLFKLRLGTTPQLCRSGWKILSQTRDYLARLRDGVLALRRGTA